MPDLELNQLPLDNKVTEKEKEVIPRLENSLEPIDQRRLEVIMTGAIRTQVRLNAAGIKNPQGEHSPEFAHIAHYIRRKPHTISYGIAHLAQILGPRLSSRWTKPF